MLTFEEVLKKDVYIIVNRIPISKQDLSKLEVASVRISEEEKRFLDQLIIQGKFSSVSEALKAGLYELMKEEQLERVPWKTRAEVRKYFSGRKRLIKGLEDLHDEDD